MAEKEIQVYKKIVWGLKGMTKEKIETYKHGESLESASTKIAIGDNSTEWNLCLYPGGNKETIDSVGLFLILKKADSKSFKTEFILGVVGKNGNKDVKCEMAGESFGHGYGISALLKRNELFALDGGFLVDDKLKFYCKLIITAKEAAKSYEIDPMKQNLLNNFKRMMDDELFADFDVETEDKKIIKAHKNVLAFGSPFFYGMLTTKMKENESNVVKVPEDYEVMKEVLRFIYSSEVENLSLIANELVFAAEKYQLDGLKQLCIVHIGETLSTKNVLQSLMAADCLTNSETLKAKCIEMIARNFNSLSATADWKELSPSMLTEIMSEIADDKDTIYV